MVLDWGRLSGVNFAPQGQYLEILIALLILTVRRRYRHLVGRSHGCCQTSHSSQESSPQQRITQPKKSPVRRPGTPLSNSSPTATGTLWMMFTARVLGNGAWSGKSSIYIPTSCEYSSALSNSPSLPFPTKHSKLQSENRQLILSQNVTPLICFPILPAKSSTIKRSASTKPNDAKILLLFQHLPLQRPHTLPPSSVWELATSGLKTKHCFAWLVKQSKTSQIIIIKELSWNALN